MNRVRIDVRLEFDRPSHRPRLDPAQVAAKKQARDRRWQIANRAHLADLARKYRARRIAAGLPSDGRPRKTTRRWTHHQPQLVTRLPATNP